MKKLILSGIAVLVSMNIFSQSELTATDKKNITDIKLINGETIAYSYFEDCKGLLSATREYYVSWNNETYGPYENVKDLAYSVTEKAVAYTAKIDGKWYIITGNKKSEAYDFCDLSIQSLDGISLTYNVKINEKNFIISGNKRFGPIYETKDACVSPDGKTLAYSAKIDGNWYIIAGEEKAGPYGDYAKPCFSPDGKTLAYPAKIDGKFYLTAENKKTGPYDDCSSVRFSSDGKTISYLAEINDIWYNKVLLNGKTYTGALCDDAVIYIDGNRILKR